MTPRLFAGAAATICMLVACASDPPSVPGFDCGAWTDHVCPPASKCVMKECDHNDCPTSCIATTPCDPSHDACPNATVCDPSTSYCMPRTICKTKADCKPDELCLTGANMPFAHPVCYRE